MIAVYAICGYTVIIVYLWLHQPRATIIPTSKAKNLSMKLFFDGGCRPNPGAMTACVVIDEPRSTHQKPLGYGTNNIAEWLALLYAMELALSYGATEIELIGDSALIVNQANGLWKIKQTEFLPHKASYDRLRGQFSQIVLSHVKRRHNLAGHVLEAAGA